jgi:hypothetical protein
MPIPQVPDCDHGLNRRTLAHVEMHERIGHGITGLQPYPPQQFMRETARPELAALKRKECHFFRRIKPP